MPTAPLTRGCPPRLLLIAGAALCAAGPAWGADPPPAPAQEEAEQQRRVKEALSLHDEARELYQRGEYRAAIAKFQEAAKLDPLGKELIYNLAVIHEKLGEIDLAEQHYRQYLEMETDPKAKEQVEAVLRRLAGAKKELEKPEPEKPAPPPALPPVVVTAPPAPDGSRPVEPWVLATGSVALGALVIGNVFAVSALIRNPGSDARTGGGVSAEDLQADADAAHRDAVVADVALLIAGLAGGTALYLYLSTPPRRPPAPPPSRPTPAPPRPFSHSPWLPSGASGPDKPALRPGPHVRVSVGPLAGRLEIAF